MGAQRINVDWTMTRALAALNGGSDIDLLAYAEEFNLDEDDTLSLFESAAFELGMAFELKEKVNLMLH